MPCAAKNYRLYRNEAWNWQRLFKSCQLLFKLEWLCTSSTPVIVHSGLNDQWRHMLRKLKTVTRFRRETQTWQSYSKYWLYTRLLSKKHLLTNYSSAKHQNHSKLRDSRIREKPVIFLVANHRAGKFAPVKKFAYLSSLAKVSVPVYAAISWLQTVLLGVVALR